MVGAAHDEDDDFLDLPPGSLADGETVGVEDSEALTDTELELGADEDVGLDTEALGGGPLDDELDDLDDEDSALFAAEGEPLDFMDELADEGEEGGWTDESEGAPLGEEEEFDDEPHAAEDDGGLEGIDDPSISALEHDGELPPLDDDGEGDFDDDSELSALILELDPH
jgi:hypothetical protein